MVTGAAAERQLREFVDKFDPEIAQLVRSARTALRKRMPGAIEQIYDNYNFLAIGFCTTERTSDCVVSLAASAKGVALSFYHGASLPDPHKILLGSGKQNRFIRLEGAKTLAQPAVKQLIAEAIAQAASPMPGPGKGQVVIKSISAKQRPRKAAETSAPSAKA
jgi:hypothetical protein